MDIPIEGTDWQIGLVVGPSGSGKTTIGRRLFPDAHFHAGYQWPETQAVVDGFPAQPGRAGNHRRPCRRSASPAPPHWLKRYAHLSNGQKFRCELARLMLEDAEVVIFDEFTSRRGPGRRQGQLGRGRQGPAPPGPAAADRAVLPLRHHRLARSRLGVQHRRRQFRPEVPSTTPKSKGLDYAEDFATYELAIEQAVARDGGASMLSLAPQPVDLNRVNLPDGSFGV